MRIVMITRYNSPTVQIAPGTLVDMRPDQAARDLIDGAYARKAIGPELAAPMVRVHDASIRPAESPVQYAVPVPDEDRETAEAGPQAPAEAPRGRRRRTAAQQVEDPVDLEPGDEELIKQNS